MARSGWGTAGSRGGVSNRKAADMAAPDTSHSDTLRAWKAVGASVVLNTVIIFAERDSNTATSYPQRRDWLGRNARPSLGTTLIGAAFIVYDPAL